jgi:hypothetical protein
VLRGDAVHRRSRPRWLLGTRGRTGLASTVGPVLVGVIFAFAWNMATSHRPQVPQPGPGLAPTVGMAVDQAADQAWASATPITTHLRYRSTAAPAASPGPASTVCHGAKSWRMVRTAPMADSAHASACSSPRRFPKPGKAASATSAWATTWSAHHGSGHSSSMIVVVPTRGKSALEFVRPSTVNRP